MCWMRWWHYVWKPWKFQWVERSWRNRSLGHVFEGYTLPSPFLDLCFLSTMKMRSFCQMLLPPYSALPLAPSQWSQGLWTEICETVS
jgi:hypothetical protein